MICQIGCSLVVFVTTFAIQASTFAEDLRVLLGDIKDHRTTTQSGFHFGTGLEIEIKVLGDDLESVKALRPLVSKAVDDSGRNLIDSTKKQSTFVEYQGGTCSSPLSLQLKNPARKALAVKELAGSVEIYCPKNDPDSTIVVKNPAGEPKRVLTHPALEAARIKLTLFTKQGYDKEQKPQESTQPNGVADGLAKAFARAFGGNVGGSKNSALIAFSDPQSRLVKIEFVDKQGKPLEPNGGVCTVNDVRSYDFSEPLPPDAEVRIYVATPKSLKLLPFNLNDVPLP